MDGWINVLLCVGNELIDYRGSSINKSKFAFSMFQPLNQSLEIWSNVSRAAQWILEPSILAGSFPGGSVVKNPPAMHETKEMRVWSLSQKDPLKEAMATHSSILAWEIAWTEEPGGLQSMGLQRVGHDWACMHTLVSLSWLTEPYSFWGIISFHLMLGPILASRGERRGKEWFHRY